jgi:futalosine hydrolase
MYILLAAATIHEIRPSVDFLKANQFTTNHNRYQVLITGVGSVAAAYSLTSFIKLEKPDLVIAAGIGGSFDPRYDIGTVVLINEEVIADLGVQEGQTFRDLFDLGFVEKDQAPFSDGMLRSTQIWPFEIEMVRGCTINEITTNRQRINDIVSKYNPTIESMEGAALQYVCNMENIPLLHLRSVSNFVGERNKENWDIKNAIKNLNETLIKIINTIDNKKVKGER